MCVNLIYRIFKIKGVFLLVTIITGLMHVLGCHGKRPITSYESMLSLNHPQKLAKSKTASTSILNETTTKEHQKSSSRKYRDFKNKKKDYCSRF